MPQRNGAESELAADSRNKSLRFHHFQVAPPCAKTMNTEAAPSVEVSPVEVSSVVRRRVDWDRLLFLFNEAIARGIEEKQLFAINELGCLCANAPADVTKRTVAGLVRSMESSYPSVKRSAARCLHVFASSNDGSLRASVGQGGGVTALLRLLQHCAGELQMIYAKCLRDLLEFENQNRVTFAKICGLETIRDMIDLSSGEIRGVLLEILVAAIQLEEARLELVHSGDVRVVVEALSRGSTDARARAARVVGLMATYSGARRLLADSGAVPPMVDLLREGDEEAKLVAANSLALLLCRVEYRELAAEAGAIPLYAELLEGGNQTGKEIAQYAFSILCTVEENCVQICRQLVRILRGNNPGAKSKVIDVFWELTAHKYSTSFMAETGAVPCLLDLLREGGDVGDNALGLLFHMSCRRAGRRALADQGVISVLTCLMRSESEQTQDLAVQALMNFAEDPSLRRRVAHVLDDPLFRTIRSSILELRDHEEELFAGGDADEAFSSDTE